MAYPVDQKTAFFNTNKHDAFGHDGRDGCGRTLPHTGIDFRGSGPVNSVYGGQVVWSNYDKEAGYSVVIAENDGRARGYGHMAGKGPEYGKVVGAGDRIGTIGASGTGAKGAHLHMWEATSVSAAIRVLTGYINYKGSGTTKQWADGMGLVDPMPRIQESLRDTEKEEDFMATLSEEEKQELFALLRATRGDQVYDNGTRSHRADMQTTLARIETLAANNAVNIGKIHDNTSQDRVKGVENGIVIGKIWDKVSQGTGSTVSLTEADLKTLAEALRENLGKDVANELGQRLVTDK